VRRAREAVAAADVVLRVVDATDEDAPGDPAAAEDEIVVLNKCDLGDPAPLSNLAAPLAISCTTGAGIDALVDALAARVRTEPAAGRDSLAAVNARHQACLFRAETALADAAARLAAGEAPEFVALDLRTALDAAGEVVGVVDTDDILGRIFGSFCIGK